MPPELRTERLSVHYRQAAAVTNADLVVPGGKVTGLVGPNGAGKSSTLLAVYGSVEATGKITYDGADLSKMSSASRARHGIGIVPQGRQLFAHLSVKENLRVMAELLKAPPDALDKAMDRFPILRTRARSLAGVLSGGEQQMMVVARALMGSPRVLLLDEMATGLAPIIVQGLMETVEQLATEDGVAVVYAAPEIGAVKDRIHRGYVMIRGQVVVGVEGGGEQLNQAYQSAMGVDLAAVSTTAP